VWERLQPTRGATLDYVEGWGVRERDGKLEPFEHGWVEDEGTIVDRTPNHGCRRYFPALRFRNPHAECYARGLDVPFYRALVCPRDRDGNPNLNYDAERALAYAQGKRDADAYCRERA
jgi:hypothetical protein